MVEQVRAIRRGAGESTETGIEPFVAEMVDDVVDCIVDVVRVEPSTGFTQVTLIEATTTDVVEIHNELETTSLEVHPGNERIVYVGLGKLYQPDTDDESDFEWVDEALRQ